MLNFPVFVHTCFIDAGDESDDYISLLYIRMICESVSQGLFLLDEGGGKKNEYRRGGGQDRPEITNFTVHNLPYPALPTPLRVLSLEYAGSSFVMANVQL